MTQGLPSYATLARGKTTLVKFFLTRPASCAELTGKSIQITGGALRVTTPAGTTPITELTRPTPGSTATVPDHSQVQPDAPADPVFVVPGSALAPGSGSAFTATFAATINYVVTDGSTSLPGQLEITRRPGTTSSITASVAAATDPVRILVVPMGDKDSALPQFPAEAHAAVANGMTAVSRLLPVAEGVSGIGGTGGLQYRLAAGMVNLGKHQEVDDATGNLVNRNYMLTGSYCGNGSHLKYIKQELGEHLNQYNSQNPDAPAERVLGVIWEGVSQGPSTHVTSSCVEGFASLGGPFAWVRAVGPSLVAPGGPREGVTGATAALELVHTYGGSLQASSYHSPNVQADTQLGDTDRGYNTTRRTYLANDRSALQFNVSPWDDYATLMEKPDWELVGCVLARRTDCGTTAKRGGSAAAPAFVLAGTSGSVTDVHSYFDGGQQLDGLDIDSASLYRLVQRAPDGTILRNDGVRVERQESAHAHEASTSTTSEVTFGVALKAEQVEPLKSEPGKTHTFQLYRGQPDSGTLLYERRLDGAPQFVRSSDRPLWDAATQYSSDGTSSMPDLSPDGTMVSRAVTGATGTTVRVSPVQDAASGLAASVEGSEAAWHPSGNELAVVQRGSVVRYAVSRDTTGKIVLTRFAGTGEYIYDARQAALTGNPGASGIAYANRGTHLAAVIRNDLWAIRLDGPLFPVAALECDETEAVSSAGIDEDISPCLRLTRTGVDSESSPAWSPDDTSTPADERDTLLAYAVGNEVVYTLDPTAPLTARVKRVGGAWNPAFSAQDLFVADGGGIGAYDARGLYTTAGALSGRLSVSAAAGDRLPAPSAQGGRVAFVRSTDVGGSDVFLTQAGKRQVDVVVSDNSPGNARLDVAVRCGDVVDPVVTAARPQVSGATATFSESYDASRVCPNGVTIYRVTDGYETAEREEGPTPGFGIASVAVYTPSANDVVLQHQPIAVAGGAVDAFGRPADAISWTLQGPAGSGYEKPTSLGTGTVLPDLKPAAAAGWLPGSWSLTATYFDAVTGTVSTTRSFTITADRDGDGLPDLVDVKDADLRRCFPADAVTNPVNAQQDPDGDLVLSLYDDRPCDSDVNLTVRFTSRSVDGDSQGNFVKLRVTSTAVDLSKTTAANTLLTSIGGHPLTLQPKVIKVFSPGEVMLSFSKAEYIAAVAHFGITGTVPVALRTTSTAGYGFDPAAPSNV